MNQMYSWRRRMAFTRWTRRNKNELIVLTGAVYAFVSYLTAFTLEILFLLDTARRNSDLVATSSTDSDVFRNNYPDSSARGLDPMASSTLASETFMDRFNFESIQTHLAISCLAIAVLYFLLFIASLKLIVALILRSTFMILIWMCLMTTLYLPEFGLVIYVSLYCWGLETRNGQTELLFYLFRAILNILFILSARKLFKEWSFEKTFLRLKSSSTGYDSPYFISGADCRSANIAGFNRGAFLGHRNDSLSTTINPLFSSSTLNLNLYDQMNTNSNLADCSPLSSHRHHNYAYDNNSGSMAAPEWSLGANNLWRLSPKEVGGRSVVSNDKSSPRRNENYLAGRQQQYNEAAFIAQQQQQMHNHEARSSRMFNGSGGRSPDDEDDGDNLTSCELDLEYRTLSHCRHATDDADERMSTNCATNQSSTTPAKQQHQQQQQQHQETHQLVDSYRHQHRANNSNINDVDYDGTMSSCTQSLDRRYLRSHFAANTQPQQQHRPPNVSSLMHDPEQVILRPLRHRPFDYLHRPGSSSNLNNY